MLRRAFPAVFALLLIALSVPAVAQDWKGRGRMQGVVTDPDDNPVVGAEITLILDDDGPEPLITNKKGRWSILGLAGGTWAITIKAEGFMISQGTVPLSEITTGPTKPIPIRMKWLPEGTEQEAAPGDPEFSAREKIEEGNQLLIEERFADARAAYEEALPHVMPESQGALLRGIARTWFAEGDTDRAITTLEEAVAQDANDTEAMQLLISLLVGADRNDEAKTYIDRLPEGADVDVAADLNMGIELFNSNDLEGAMEHFSRVVAHNPELSDGYYYRGLIYLNQGESEAAAADFRRLLELDAEHAKAEEVRGFLDYLPQP